MIQIFINDEEVVCNKNININEEILATSSLILDNVYPKSWEDDKDYTSRFYYPKDYSKCRIYKDKELIFCGVVKNSGDISINPRYAHYGSLQVLDFKTFLSEGDTLDFVISDKTIEEAIDMVIYYASQYGFIKGVVNIFGADEKIGAYSTLDKSPYDVFQYIADITGSKWLTRTIDEYTVAIDFYDPTLMPRSDNIEYTTEYFKENNIQDMSFNYGSYDYRNKQIMLSNEVFSNIEANESIYTDGYNKTFTLNSKIGVINSIMVNGTEKTFATNDDKELGIEADFYYKAGENTLEQNDATSYIAGTQIAVNYIALVQGRQIINNVDEINRINSQLGIKGDITRYENRNDVLSSAELIKVGESYIRYKGSAEINLTVTTYNKDLFNIGQVTYFDAPIEDLKQDYMVKSKETQIMNANNLIHIVYVYTLVSNFNSERDINWFDNQRNKISGNISQGDYITRNIDKVDEINIVFSNLSVSELQVTGDNTLNSVLNSPFVD